MAVAPAPLPWVHPVTCLPEPVRAEVARRREQILARANGRVLDLDDPGVAARFAAIGRTGLTPAPSVLDERYDTVVATGVLSAFADLGSVVAALARCVADDGCLLVVEPVGRPGWTNLVRTTLRTARRQPAWHGLHLDRDVPAAVRATGLTICDLDRGELPAQPLSLRHWVSGRALRIPSAGGVDAT